VIDRFAAENDIAGLSVSESAAVMQKLSPVITPLLLGALEISISLLQTIETDTYLTAEKITQYVNEITAFVQSE
jgi:hypothetical protein